jgi:hypothetical protein
MNVGRAPLRSFLNNKVHLTVTGHVIDDNSVVGTHSFDQVIS